MAMCQSESTSKTSYPKWVTKGGKDAFKNIEDFSNKSANKYKGDRVAPLTSSQTMGIDALGDYYANGPDPNVYGDVSSIFSGIANKGVDSEARNLVSTAASAGPQSVSTERVVDENGRLGAISDYMNPYLDQVLNPALRAVDEGAAAERKRIGDMATSSGAYGDARHGVLELDTGERTNRARGDVAGNIYAGGYDTAMGLRQSDLDRFLNTDITNANFSETALNRAMQGGRDISTMEETAANRQLAAGGAMSDAADAEQARKLARINALLTGGAIEQQTAQNALDAKYEDFLRRKNDQYDRFQLLLSALNGTSFNRTVTTSQPDNSWAAFAGSAAGSLPFL